MSCVSERSTPRGAAGPNGLGSRRRCRCKDHVPRRFQDRPGEIWFPVASTSVGDRGAFEEADARSDRRRRGGSRRSQSGPNLPREDYMGHLGRDVKPLPVNPLSEDYLDPPAPKPPPNFGTIFGGFFGGV